MPILPAALCAVLSGVAFYFSTGLGDIWPLAWIAPVPVLWLAFRPGNAWIALAAAGAAGMMGALNLLPAYLGIMPTLALVVIIVLQGLGLALCVAGARLVALRLSPLSGALAFAASWTTLDFLAAQGPHGSALSPAYSQVGMPILIQGASVFGIWIVTALLGLFAAGIAASAATRRLAPALMAAAALLLNVGYGGWRMTGAPRTAVTRIGLAADDALAASGRDRDEKSTLAVTDSYAEAARSFGTEGVSLVVFPEKIAVVTPESSGTVNAEFETDAHIAHETIVVGLDHRGAQRQNVARIFFANGAPPMSYAKRHLVPGLEDAFVPGKGSFMLANHTGVAICKDMDFPQTLRTDALLHPTLYAVPAWDFGADAWWHARLAIMRGVENGFSVARAARQGLLTLSDAYGRVLGEQHSGAAGMATLVGDLPRGPGRTLYGRIGDTFAWFCMGLCVGLVGFAFARGRQ
ncbi:MAG: hypothetical protein KGJ78_09220 [Alphaproteobacteria bacterium]|nr:hypothetical protein [Alphaproteobacteria bacterium]